MYKGHRKNARHAVNQLVECLALRGRCDYSLMEYLVFSSGGVAGAKDAGLFGKPLLLSFWV